MVISIYIYSIAIAHKDTLISLVLVVVRQVKFVFFSFCRHQLGPSQVLGAWVHFVLPWVSWLENWDQAWRRTVSELQESQTVPSRR